MAKEIIIQADSAAQALEQACRQLGKKQEELSFVVLKEAKKSIFGKIKEQAEIKITYDDQEEPVTAVEVDLEASAEHPAGEDTTANKIREAQEYLKNVLSAMGLVGIEQQVERDEDNVRIILKGDNLGVAIGRRGETLDALQYLVSLVANRIEGDYVRFIIDSGNFREKREETLRNLASKIARTTLKTGRNSTLEPMNPYERRIIHSVVSEINGVYSKSVGEEPNRKVVVFSENPRKFNNRPPRDNRSGQKRDRRPGNRGADRGNNRPRKYDKDYIPTNVSSEPSTYNFEKEFLKSERKDAKLYSKIEFDD